MNIQRFHAPTAREALLLARQTFGDGTLILSNRPTANGGEAGAGRRQNAEFGQLILPCPIPRRGEPRRGRPDQR